MGALKLANLCGKFALVQFAARTFLKFRDVSRLIPGDSRTLCAHFALGQMNAAAASSPAGQLATFAPGESPAPRYSARSGPAAAGSSPATLMLGTCVSL